MSLPWKLSHCLYKCPYPGNYLIVSIDSTYQPLCLCQPLHFLVFDTHTGFLSLHAVPCAQWQV